MPPYGPVRRSENAQELALISLRAVRSLLSRYLCDVADSSNSRSVWTGTERLQRSGVMCTFVVTEKRAAPGRPLLVAKKSRHHRFRKPKNKLTQN